MTSRRSLFAVVSMVVALLLAWATLRPSTTEDAASLVSPPRPVVAEPASSAMGDPLSVPPAGVDTPRQVVTEATTHEDPPDTGEAVAGWPHDLPEEYLPAAVYDAVERSERLCFAQSTTTLEVDCEEFPCLVASLSEDGVVVPFCEEAEAPPFPQSWAREGSPISLRLRRFSKVQPMVPESWLEQDPDLYARIRLREWAMTKDWVKGRR